MGDFGRELSCKLAARLQFREEKAKIAMGRILRLGGAATLPELGE